MTAGDPAERRLRDRWWVGALLWVLAVALTLAISVHQRRTGPTVSLPHVLLMLFAVIWGLRTLAEAAVGRRGIRWQSRTTLALIGLGGLVFGPIVQEFAFGAYWTGVPFGWDLTDNKTLVMFLCWLVAVVAQGWRVPITPWGRRITLVAAVMMVAVYLVPHSMYGSELDYEEVDGGVDPAEAIGQG